MATDPLRIAALMASEIERQQAECQREIDAGWDALRAFLESGEGSIEPYLMRILRAEMWMAIIPEDVEDDFRILSGLDAPTQGRLNA